MTQEDSRPARPIESASASTAPQTGSSNAPYALVGTVLGLITLVIVAIALVVIAATSTALEENLSEYRGDRWGMTWEETHRL